ncbi:hypothetical protein [Nonomuraea soli]|uniref:Uncharacterized protein n=1 Tax=Nonomuraea soli TaxID=1032476 RepID=A0A7W0CM51_9ACTN|nr:hypothetical protein [Nonomuraea soli]MBA2893727.1 hypothetical protein [Nonomuraea soli]
MTIDSTPRPKVKDRAAPGRRWPARVTSLAALWSLAYGALGLWWTFGGDGFPFGVGDREAELSLLAGLTPQIGGPVIAALGLGGALVALLMARGAGPRPLVIGFAAIMAVGLAVVIPDYRVLMLVAYAPILLVALPLGLLPIDPAMALAWPRINLLIVTAGGILWGVAALAYHRRTAGACVSCGRRDTLTHRHWTTPESARRWGFWAVHVAALVPEIYGVTRYAWALGIPLGMDAQTHAEGAESGLWLVGAFLGVLGTLGAILTIGLNRPWSEIWPRWVPRLRGRRVPTMFPVIFAGIVSVVVLSAGLMFWWQTLRTGFDWANWAMGGPQMLWPLWGVALAVAAYGYYLRTRGTCRTCGRS